MQYQTIEAPASLHPFVKCFWSFEGNQEGQSYVYRSLADGCAELIFHYKGLFSEPDVQGNPFYAGLAAQTTEYKRYITNEPFGIFGAYLYPFAIPLLFNIPAHELTGEMPDLVTLLGNEGRMLQDTILQAPGNHQRSIILGNYLEKKLQNRFSEHDAVFSAIRHVIQAEEISNIPALSGMFCMSERTLERKFKDFAGLSPKLLFRLSRFKSTLNDYGNQTRSLTDIAHACGYYDQSHFISEFKSFSGYHPRQYFHGRPEGVEWRDA